MIDIDKKQFWLMINVTMELTNKLPLTKEAIIVWWALLKKYDFKIVEQAINKWVDNSSKPPTPHDIVGLCKHKNEIYKSLPAPINKEANKAHSTELIKIVKEGVKAPTDMRGWARLIKANPKNYPDISLRYAEEALV